MYSRKNRLNIHMRTHVTFDYESYCGYISRLEKNHLSALMMVVQKHLLSAEIWKHIWGFIRVKNLLFVNFQTVWRLSLHRATWQITCADILVIDLLNVIFAIIHSWDRALWKFISGDTQESDHMTAIIVERNFLKVATWKHISKHMK